MFAIPSLKVDNQMDESGDNESDHKSDSFDCG